MRSIIFACLLAVACADSNADANADAGVYYGTHGYHGYSAFPYRYGHLGYTYGGPYRHRYGFPGYSYGVHALAKRSADAEADSDAGLYYAPGSYAFHGRYPYNYGTYGYNYAPASYHYNYPTYSYGVHALAKRSADAEADSDAGVYYSSYAYNRHPAYGFRGYNYGPYRSTYGFPRFGHYGYF